ncbi:hypothetical protein GCM10020220_045630 [Nonomuraea rubra]
MNGGRHGVFYTFFVCVIPWPRRRQGCWCRTERLAGSDSRGQVEYHEHMGCVAGTAAVEMILPLRLDDHDYRSCYMICFLLQADAFSWCGCNNVDEWGKN